ncbi:MAG: YtxH domain-containing protein [Rhodothermales bacterium]|nr:YtxH domain-containing protein [Rhodothermales bacterium]
MKSSSALSLLASAASGFALGVAAGLLFAPQSGDKLRTRIADEVREQVRQAEARLKDLDTRFQSLETRLSAAGQDVTRRVRTAAEQARDTVLPTLDAAAEAARIDEKELGQDLRHMTRR